MNKIKDTLIDIQKVLKERVSVKADKIIDQSK